jgi:hypothetical protein
MNSLGAGRILVSGKRDGRCFERSEQLPWSPLRKHKSPGFAESLCASSRTSTVWSDALNEATLSKQELDVQFDKIFQSWDSKPCGSRAVSSSASSRSNVKSCSFFAELLEAELERKSV